MPGFSCVAGRRSRGFAVCGRSRGGNHRKWRWRHVSGVVPGPPRRREYSPRVVPFLVAAGVIILMIQPALMKLPEGWVRRTPLLQLGLVGAVCVYGGYFGAGSGVMLLAVILVLVDSRIAPANAIKNVLLGVTSLVAAAVFIATGPVLWAAVLPLAGGLLVGSALGPIIVRHLPPNLVRWMAATFGFILAIYLWIRPP